MKYSLKNEYTYLLKEFEDLQNVQYYEDYSDNKVRVIFPGDNTNIARIYNTKEKNVDAVIKEKEISLRKDEEVQLNTISVINKGYLSCANKHTDKQLQSGSAESNFKKSIVNLINQYCENKLVSDIINFSETSEKAYKINEKLKSYKEGTEKENIVKHVTDQTIYSSSNNNIYWKNFGLFMSNVTDESKIKFVYNDFINTEGLKRILSSSSASDFDEIKKNFKGIVYNKNQISNDYESFISEIIDKCIDIKISFIKFKINCQDFEEQEDDFLVSKLKKSDVLKAILYEYCDNISLPTFISHVKELGNKEEIFRKECNNIESAIDHLNNNCNPFISYKGKGGNQGEAKGAGEFHVHALLKTTNACQKIEPDAILNLSERPFPCSIKQFVSQSAEAQTGGSMSSHLRSSCYKFLNSLFVDQGIKKLNSAALTGSGVPSNDDKIDIVNVKNQFKFFKEENGKILVDDKVRAECLDNYKKFKELIASEHNSEGIIAYYPKSKPLSGNHFNFVSKEKCRDFLTLARIPSNERISFSIMTTPADSRNRLDRIILYLLDDTYKHPQNLSLKKIVEEYNNSLSEKYIPQGRVLKEVYSHLFKKKIIKEGGLAGHMMHPYEALDMTPRQIIDRVKEYSTSQKIIEKVDGQNLFFTVEEDGTLMFARNKEDMTHDDLVAKFTGHPAELPFVEGGNAVKSGIEQWLQSAGPAAEMEIREIFHPDGETKSFVNFEIMHPDKPNQIVYDEKYIVFHSIVDFVNGRESTYSTNKGQRLEKLIRLMDSGVTANGFTLASNRTVNLNELTNVQIEEYVERVKEVALSLGIYEDITLGEGIENIIKQEIEGLGINLDRETLKKIYDFVLYGEDRQGNKIKSKDFTSSLIKSDAAGLRSLDLTNASKALKKVQRIISPFKDVFVDLGVDLLKGVKSAYMSDETNQKNIELLRDKLQTAIDDLTNYMNEKPENYWEAEVHRLRPHLDKVIDKDISDIVATTVEGGVYDYQGDLIKVTGGFAPLNQILGAAYRDKKGIFPTFKQKFMQQESNRRSLKGVFNLIF